MWWAFQAICQEYQLGVFVSQLLKTLIKVNFLLTFGKCLQRNFAAISSEVVICCEILHFELILIVGLSFFILFLGWRPLNLLVNRKFLILTSLLTRVTHIVLAAEGWTVH